MAEYNESQINSNETERISAEQQRINNEAQRQTNETEREAREATRQSNESTRISKEAERLAEEVNRQEAEASRVTAEQGRVEAENVRAEFYEGFNDKLDAVDSQLAHIINKEINIVALGAIGDGVTDNSDIFQYALDLQQQTGKPIIIPTGIFLLSKVGVNQTTVTNPKKDIIIKGYGSTSIIKRGDNTITKDFNSLIYIKSYENNPKVNILLDNFYIEDNALNNQTENPVSWEHCHAISIVSRAVRGFDITVNNLTVNNCCADAIGIGGDGNGTFNSIMFSNFRECGTPLQGHRSGIVVTGCYDTLNINNVDVNTIRVEVNKSECAINGERVDTNISNFTINNRLYLDNNDLSTPCKVSNGIVRGQFYVHSFSASFNNVDFILKQAFRLSGSSNFSNGEYYFNNCIFYANENFKPSSYNSMQYMEQNGKPHIVEYNNCRFDKDDSVQLNYYIYNNEMNVGDYQKIVNCTFGNITSSSIAVQDGNYYIKNNTFNQEVGNAIVVLKVNNYKWKGDSDIYIRNNEILNNGVYLLSLPGNRRENSGNYYKANYYISDNKVKIDYVVKGISSRIIDVLNGGTATSGVDNGYSWNKFLEMDTILVEELPASGTFLKGQRIKYIVPKDGKQGAINNKLGCEWIEY